MEHYRTINQELVDEVVFLRETLSNLQSESISLKKTLMEERLQRSKDKDYLIQKLKKHFFIAMGRIDPEIDVMDLFADFVKELDTDNEKNELSISPLTSPVGKPSLGNSLESEEVGDSNGEIEMSYGASGDGLEVSKKRCRNLSHSEAFNISAAAMETCFEVNECSNRDQSDVSSIECEEASKISHDGEIEMSYGASGDGLEVSKKRFRRRTHSAADMETSAERNEYSKRDQSDVSSKESKRASKISDDEDYRMSLDLTAFNKDDSDADSNIDLENPSPRKYMTRGRCLQQKSKK